MDEMSSVLIASCVCVCGDHAPFQTGCSPAILRFYCFTCMLGMLAEVYTVKCTRVS